MVSHSVFLFESLPENLRLEICSKVGAADVKQFFNLRTVSKNCRQLCNEGYALRRVSFKHFPLRPWFRFSENAGYFTNFVYRCYEAGNPEGAYRLGLLEYFGFHSDEQQQKDGLERLAFAAEEGLDEAQYIYGSILVCLGGADKNKGLQLLNPLPIPVLQPGDWYWIEHCWMRHLEELKLGGQQMAKRLKSTYVREDCNCGGSMEGLSVAPSDIWDFFERYHNYRNIAYSVTCPLCTNHYIIQAFFDVLEDSYVL